MILRGGHECKPFHLTILYLKFSPQAIIPWAPSGAEQRLRNPRKLAALLACCKSWTWTVSASQRQLLQECLPVNTVLPICCLLGVCLWLLCCAAKGSVWIWKHARKKEGSASLFPWIDKYILEIYMCVYTYIYTYTYIRVYVCIYILSPSILFYGNSTHSTNSHSTN